MPRHHRDAAPKESMREPDLKSAIRNGGDGKMHRGRSIKTRRAMRPIDTNTPSNTATAPATATAPPTATATASTTTTAPPTATATAAASSCTTVAAVAPSSSSTTTTATATTEATATATTNTSTCTAPPISATTTATATTTTEAILDDTNTSTEPPISAAAPTVANTFRQDQPTPAVQHPAKKQRRGVSTANQYALVAANNEADFADVFDAEVSSDDEEDEEGVERPAQMEIDASRIGRMIFAKSEEEPASESEEEVVVDSICGDDVDDDDDDESAMTVVPVLLLGREYLNNDGSPPMQRMGRMDQRVRGIAREYSAKLVKIIDPLLLDPLSKIIHDIQERKTRDNTVSSVLYAAYRRSDGALLKVGYASTFRTRKELGYNDNDDVVVRMIFRIDGMPREMDQEAVEVYHEFWDAIRDDDKVHPFYHGLEKLLRDRRAGGLGLDKKVFSGLLEYGVQRKCRVPGRILESLTVDVAVLEKREAMVRSAAEDLFPLLDDVLQLDECDHDVEARALHFICRVSCRVRLSTQSTW